MNLTRLLRISALIPAALLSALPAFALPPCGCDYCQRFPERNCTTGGTVTTCAQFLTVALCPAGSAAVTASEETFLAAFAAPAEEQGVCLSPAR